MKLKSTYLFLFVAVLLFVFSIDVSAQCAMCKAAAESSLENNSHSIVRGLNKGILFLMVIPYLIVGVIFRKELVVLIKIIRGKAKEPMNKERMQWLSFAATFASVLLILFILFLNVQYRQ